MNHQLKPANLFANDQVRLAAIDPEHDAAALARWTYDTEYRRLLDSDPVRPSTAASMRSYMEQRAGRPKAFGFAIHALPEDTFIGTLGLWVQDWSNAEAFLGIGIGERAYWSRGYGSAAIRLALRYAFDELNLERVSLEANSDNARAIRAYEKVGFTHEGTQLEWEGRDGRRAHLITMGILREEWQRLTNQPEHP